MVKHIVIFQLVGTPNERKQLASLFKQALEALPRQIPQLRKIEVGLNQNPNEQADLVLTATVDTLDDVALYAGHPAHIEAASIVKGHVKLRACVDYIV